MAVSAETRAFVLELFDDLPDVAVRAMMGGLAIYSLGRIFAIVGFGDRVFIKAVGPLAEALAAEGSEQFTYEKTGQKTARQKTARMGYWTLPDAAMDDPEQACAWARRSLSASGDPGFS